jgi:predicted lipoprotein
MNGVILRNMKKFINSEHFSNQILYPLEGLDIAE